MAQRQHTQKMIFDALFAERMPLLDGISLDNTPLTTIKLPQKCFFKPSMKLRGSGCRQKWHSMDIDAITEDYIENENEPAHFQALATFWGAAHTVFPKKIPI